MRSSDSVDTLGAALGCAHATLAAANFAWAKVTGPFGASIVTARRLGWRYVGGLRFKTDDGELLDLAESSPQYVKLRVRKSTRRWRNAKIEEHLPGIGVGEGGLVVKGVTQSAKPPDRKGPLAPHWVGGCAAALRSAISNGQWPQTRLKAAKLAEDDRCQLCFEDKGTTAHRRVCRSTKHLRGPGHVPAHLVSTFESLSADQKRHLLNRGLLALPSVSSHPPSQHDTLAWTMRPDDGVLHSGWTAYLDGSFRDGPSELLGRTGFGFVAYDGDGKLRAAACGVPPPWIRTIHGAELWAFFAAARISLPGVSYRTDRKAVLDTFRAGRKEATAASVELARLWRLVFDAFDDLVDPSNSVDLFWMPAHTKPSDVGEALLSNGQPLTARDRAANDAADFLAKRGAQTHRAPAWLRKEVKKHELLAIWAARTLAIATHASNNLVVAGKEGLQRDSTGLPRWKRKSATSNARNVNVNPDSANTVTARPESIACEPVVPLEVHSEGSDESSEVDLSSFDRSCTARAHKARRRKESRERTEAIVRMNSCWSVSDGNEATAPHRQRHLKERVLRRVAFAASLPPVASMAGEEAAAAATSTGAPPSNRQPTHVELLNRVQCDEARWNTLGGDPAVTVSEPPLAPSVLPERLHQPAAACHELASASKLGPPTEPTSTGRHSGPGRGDRRSLAEDTSVRPPRHPRARQSSVALERRATSAAIACLLTSRASGPSG